MIWACIDMSTKLTYRDCRKEAELFVPDVPSPRTICRRVQEIPVEKENEEKADLIMADGTKWVRKKRAIRLLPPNAQRDSTMRGLIFVFFIALVLRLRL